MKPTALITGASRGIGAACARLLASCGHDLLLVARSADALESVASELRALGTCVETASIDLARPEAIAAPLEALCGRGNTPTVVVNNAGVAVTGALATMPLERWQLVMQVNLTSVMQVCQVLVPLLRQAGGGRIINISSHAARNAFVDWGAYCVSKAALDSFSRCLALEERANGIRVSTLTLGAVNTPLWDSEMVDSCFDRRAMLNTHQAAEAVLYLAQQPLTQQVDDLTLMPAAGVL